MLRSSKHVRAVVKRSSTKLCNRHRSFTSRSALKALKLSHAGSVVKASPNISLHIYIYTHIH